MRNGVSAHEQVSCLRVKGQHPPATLAGDLPTGGVGKSANRSALRLLFSSAWYGVLGGVQVRSTEYTSLELGQYSVLRTVALVIVQSTQ